MSMLTLGLSGALAATVVPVAGASVATAPRVYEQVTPADKHAADVSVGLTASADGDAVAFQSFGAYADTTANVLATYYASHRFADGWRTTSLAAPSATPAPNLLDSFYPNDLSDDLWTAYYSAPGSSTLSTRDTNGAGDAFAVSGGVATWLSPTPELPDTATAPAYYRGHSADGRHIVLETAKQLMPSVPGGTRRVYELVDGRLRVASVLPASAGNPANPDASFGDGRASDYAGTFRPGDVRAISADGARIFFRVDGQLYVRTDGRTSDLVSASHVSGAPRAAVAGADAKFLAASQDGGRVFFTSAKPLTDAAAPNGGLYAYDLDSDVLTLLAADTATDGVLGVLRSAPDGSRIFFATTATLGDPQATAGEANVFAAGDGVRRFVGTLSASTDTALWSYSEFANATAISPDGRRLAFATMTAVGGFDPRGRSQVYEYAIGSGLTCVSCPPAGVTTSRGADLRDVEGNQQITPRAFAADGTLFFETRDALVPEDADTAADVYAYDGALHLVSTGTPTDTHIVGNSADGRDVFIRTHDALSPADRDGGVADIYDARIGGGLPLAAEPVECAGAACRGPLGADPAPPAPPASLGATDTSAPAADDERPLTFSLAKVGAAARATAARTGRLSVSVKVSDTAVLSARATATLRGAKKASTVAAATGAREGAGTVKLTLALSGKARSALKRSGKLTVRVAVSASDTKTTRRATVALRTKKAAR